MPRPVPTSVRPFVRPAVLGAALAAIALPGAAQAASVTPEVIDGNPNCEALGAGWSTILKVDPPNGGDYSGNGVDITVVKNGLSFDWSASGGVDAVIVKGGDNANVYTYAPAGADKDTVLTAPVNPQNGTTFGLSHMEFCDGPDVPVETGPGPDPEPDPKPDPDPDPKPDPKPEPEQPGQPQEPGQPQQPEQPQQPSVVTPTGTPFVAAQKSQPTKARAAVAVARLRAPGSCVRRGFRVAVDGRNMKSVTFFVNGRKVATKQAGRHASVRIPVTSGVHRIRARVRYVNGATRSTQTLKAAAVRCLQRVVSPQFTG